MNRSVAAKAVNTMTDGFPVWAPLTIAATTTPTVHSLISGCHRRGSSGDDPGVAAAGGTPETVQK
jgi:hypothetical protein